MIVYHFVIPFFPSFFWFLFVLRVILFYPLFSYLYYFLSVAPCGIASLFIFLYFTLYSLYGRLCHFQYSLIVSRAFCCGFGVMYFFFWPISLLRQRPFFIFFVEMYSVLLF